MRVNRQLQLRHRQSTFLQNFCFGCPVSCFAVASLNFGASVVLLTCRAFCFGWPPALLLLNDDLWALVVLLTLVHAYLSLATDETAELFAWPVSYIVDLCGIGGSLIRVASRLRGLDSTFTGIASAAYDVPC
jgi:hypothetical protein